MVKSRVALVLFGQLDSEIFSQYLNTQSENEGQMGMIMKTHLQLT
jgi:hypothetical protein